MTDGVGGGAIQDILNALVTVHRHGDQVALFTIGRRGDLGRRVATGEKRIGFESLGTERRAAMLDVLAIDAHLLRLAELKRVLMPRRPSVGYVNQEQRRLAERRELSHMLEDHTIVRRMLERDEDTAIHASEKEGNATTNN